MVNRALFTGFFGFILGACQHQGAPVAATLSDDSPETISALKAGLSTALGRAIIDLGAGDPTAVPSVAVLPPRPAPRETHSTAMPTLFDLYLEGDTCFAIKQGTSTRIALPDVPCKPA
ncbi:MAG: hypothetical protein AAFR51_17830 [Pseudomonadota bacterium]